ncbi:hypothetical protein ACWGJ2_10665 [Streptomyces sp. NPDC054796]
MWPEGAERAERAEEEAEAEESTGPAHVTPAGADWLASASAFPRSVHALWDLRPTAPSVLPCGTVFDIVSTSPVFGRRLLDRLWSGGPGSGPVAAHRGRALLFAAPGTAQRLPALLNWEEWRTPHGSGEGTEAGEGPESESGSGSDGPAETIPPLLCHGLGDAVTIPALRPAGPPPSDAADRPASRWLVAPDVRYPWLPGPEVLLWACVRTMRSFRSVRAGGEGRTREQSIFTTQDRDAKVYDVSRRR